MPRRNSPEHITRLDITLPVGMKADIAELTTRDGYTYMGTWVRDQLAHLVTQRLGRPTPNLNPWPHDTPTRPEHAVR